MLIKRDVAGLIHEYLQMFPCVVLLGPRQAGKTTLLTELTPARQRFDLELRADFDQIAMDPDLFLRSQTADLAIDVAQLLPDLFPALRVAIDRQRSRVGRFVLSGSSSPKLLRHVSETLAGRAAIIEISPLSFHEAAAVSQQLPKLIKSKASASELAEQLRYQSSIQNTQDVWLKGGYPEPWVRSDDRFRLVWMEQYVKSYVERDIARLFQGIDEVRFRLFIQTLASLSGRIVNYSEVARSLSVSQPTIRDYFEIADGTFIWRKIPAYEKDAVKRIVKHPRGYFRDSGLLHHLLRIRDFNDLITHPSLGNFWEGFVIEEIIRGLQSIGASFHYYYYRTGAGAEVDLVLDGDFGVVPVEIKYTQTVQAKDLRSIRDFVSERKCRIGIVINNDEKVRLFDDKIVGVPFNMI